MIVTAKGEFVRATEMDGKRGKYYLCTMVTTDREGVPERCDFLTNKNSRKKGDKVEVMLSIQAVMSKAGFATINAREV